MWKYAAIILIVSAVKGSALKDEAKTTTITSTEIDSESPELVAFRNLIFRHLNYKMHYVDQHNPLAETDVICNCTTNHCDSELRELLGDNYEGLCRGKLCRISLRHIRRESGDIEAQRVYECVDQKHMVPHDRPFVCHSTDVNSVFCCNGTLCSNGAHLEPPKMIDPHSPFHYEKPTPFEWSDGLVYVLIVLCVVCSMMVIVVIAHWKSERFRNYLKNMYASLFPPAPIGDDQAPMLNTQATLSTLLRDLDATMSGTGSGSGSGLPLLMQRTIAMQIELVGNIGKGRFGDVRLGMWKGEKVAVKIFEYRDESSFNTEVDIFNTNMLRHQNVLQFIASDRKDLDLLTELWLITEYHPNGSLSDYLEKQTIEEVIAVQMIRSIANGMQFLHTEIAGRRGNRNKPGIAHRDIKSKNILVKRDLTCVIADLGLAVVFDHGQINLPANNKCGTVRYLAPELLDDTMITQNFESYRMADMYAVGLCMFEIVRRTRSITGPPAEFEESIPYYQYVERDPTLEQMAQVVVVQGQRPCPSSHWKNNPVLSELYRVMAECWRPSPPARLTAMNVRIALDRVARKNNMNIIQ